MVKIDGAEDGTFYGNNGEDIRIIMPREKLLNFFDFLEAVEGDLSDATNSILEEDGEHVAEKLERDYQEVRNAIAEFFYPGAKR